VVGYDFSTAVMPGWRSTIFAPYFVVGAMFSGFAMVILIAAVLRSAFRLQAYVTLRHFDAMAKILLTASLIMGYSYGTEVFMAWYEGNPDDWRDALAKMAGPYAPAYWGMIFGNVLAPQVCWFRRVRHSIPTLAAVALLVSVGMWLERYVIVVHGLSHGFIPAEFRLYFPTRWDWAILVGSVGLFLWLYFLFARFVPVVPMHEVRKLAHELGREQ
jgi:Ni/Fe-hydrogenase subunit HybB-like protein